MERLPAVLGRILPLAAAVSRGVRLASLVALGSAALIAVALFRDGLPEPQARALVTALVAAAVFVPGLILFAFDRLLGELLELPAKLRSLPGAGRGHADELARLVRERRRRRLPSSAWRLFALGRSSRELLTPYAPLAPLLSPPFLLAAVLSLLATPVLVVLALVSLASLA